MLKPSRQSRVTVFVDDGCNALALINEDTAKQLSLQFFTLSELIPIFYASGQSSPAGPIRFKTQPLILDIGGHREAISFLITQITHPILLGLPWMQLHNPLVN